MDSSKPSGGPLATKSKGDALRVAFSSLFPGYFALVMATGIISITAHNLGSHGIGWALFFCNILAYPLFWAAGLYRLVTDGSGVLREITHHETGAGFLTIVAGTSMLGSEFATFQVAAWVVPGLFAVAVIFWWGFLYAFLAGVMERPRKPSLESGFGGQWLLIVVATESLAVLGADVLRQFGGPPVLAFACYAWVLLGAVFYLLLEAAVLYRFVFVPMSPDQVTGPWWINEGAAAIAVLAGAKLMAVPGLYIGPFALRDLLAPLMVVLWAEATFWIPLLLLLFAWKHIVRHRPLRYALEQWSIVFPLGMYAAATLQLSQAYDLPFLRFVPTGFFWVAFLAWVMAFVGAIRGVARGIRA